MSYAMFCATHGPQYRSPCPECGAFHSHPRGEDADVRNAIITAKTTVPITAGERAEAMMLAVKADGIRQATDLHTVLQTLKRLAFAARTSGGTAGPDPFLMKACDDAENVLVAAGFGRREEDTPDKPLPKVEHDPRYARGSTEQVAREPEIGLEWLAIWCEKSGDDPLVDGPKLTARERKALAALIRRSPVEEGAETPWPEWMAGELRSLAEKWRCDAATDPTGASQRIWCADQLELEIERALRSGSSRPSEAE